MMFRLIRIVWIAILAAFLAGCSQKETNETYSITGQVDGWGSSKVYLQQLNFKRIGRPDAVVIDTAQADETGRFQFEGMVAEPVICQVLREQDPFRILLVADNQAISLEASSGDYESVALSGSPVSEELQEFNLMMIRNTGELQELVKVTREADQSGEAQRADSLRKEFEDELSDYYTQIQEYVEQSEVNPVAFLAVESLDFSEHFGFIKQFAARAQKEAPSSFYTQDLLRKIRSFEAQANSRASMSTSADMIGQKAPEIAQPDPNGNIRKLSDLRGKVVLVDFWASWCGPCRRENPNVVKVYKEFKDNGFTIYSVSLDNDKSRWQQAIRADNLVWNNHVSELKRFSTRAVEDYGVRGIPSAFLLNREGVIVAQNLRGQALYDKVAELVE